MQAKETRKINMNKIMNELNNRIRKSGKNKLGNTELNFSP